MERDINRESEMKEKGKIIHVKRISSPLLKRCDTYGQKFLKSPHQLMEISKVLLNLISSRNDNGLNLVSSKESSLLTKTLKMLIIIIFCWKNVLKH